MFKIFFLFILFFFINHCSIDTKSGFWEDLNEISLSKNISDITFNDDLSFEEFKKNAIEYGKLSKFPKLDD